MHSKYTETIAQLKTWAQQDPTIHGVLILGSQVRKELTGDEWSDLDILLFADDPQTLLQSDVWLAFLGEVVCLVVEETPLAWLHLTWSVKRVLFADNRTVDFSMMPYDRLDDVLALNAEVHVNGYQVVYDDHPDALAAKIEATLATLKEVPPRIPAEAELRRTIHSLLFQLVFACKKIKRDELWVAVSCINQPINALLLQLIEFYTASVAKTSQRIRYEGRFLEQRIPSDLAVWLPRCFAQYEAHDAIQTAYHLLDFTRYLAQGICAANHYSFDARLFDQVGVLFTELFGGDSTP
ncbi:MAG TPA: aminoglycoside 6-adenylyltransferase [Anaerolineae bacterium]|nr:aminoglycoside 6-adenylyltransferase [Anaerolineae bacterium]